MHSKKYWLFFLLPVLISACSEVKNTKYKDTSALERPPVMEIAETPKVQIEEKEEAEKTGLGDIVSISSSAETPVIKIKKMFGRSWNIVEQGLALSEIEITDKNRDKGVFYVKFDPDRQSSKDSGMLDKMTFFLFKDDYEEAFYKMTVVWRDSNTEVSAELIDQAGNDLLDDGEDDFESSIDSGGMLIKALYKTIRDDLPID
jgi:uncharacterized lipoprotein